VARLAISVDENANVWGHGVLGELADGRVWAEQGHFHYETFRGVHYAGTKLMAVLNAVAHELGYSGATLLSSRARI
jgi:hypothetical protein